MSQRVGRYHIVGQIPTDIVEFPIISAMQGWLLSQRYSALSDTSSRLLMGNFLINKTVLQQTCIDRYKMIDCPNHIYMYYEIYS